MIRSLLMEQKHPAKIAIIEKNEAISYATLIRKAQALQPLLVKKQGENIAILLPDGGNFIAALWALFYAGVTAFPLHVQLQTDALSALLKQAHIKTILTSIQYRSRLAELSLSLEILYIEESAGGETDKPCVAQSIPPTSPMLLLHSSGTTGKSKIVQLTEANVYASVVGYLDKLRLEETNTSDFRYLLAAPFSSVYGIMILCACLMHAFPIVLSPMPFTLNALFRAAEKHKVTHYEGSTSTILLMEQMIGKPIPYDIRSLTYFGTGGSMVSGSTMQRLHEAYPSMAFYHGYGMTEAAPLVTKHPRTKLEKFDSVGTAIKGLEIAVEVAGKIVHTPHTEGEIVVKGASIMPGYYNDAVETSRALQNGYLYTGDMGYLDAEGYLYLCGRKKNIIIIRGYKVNPEEVEACICGSRLAQDCLVYGGQDCYGNETVCAKVVPLHKSVQIEDIRAHCAAHLASYKQPQQIFFCADIQKTTSGKTVRNNQN